MGPSASASGGVSRNACGGGGGGDGGAPSTAVRGAPSVAPSDGSLRKRAHDKRSRHLRAAAPAHDVHDHGLHDHDGLHDHGLHDHGVNDHGVNDNVAKRRGESSPLPSPHAPS